MSAGGNMTGSGGNIAGGAGSGGGMMDMMMHGAGPNVAGSIK